ncbi:18734_t:CDS:2 [Rhizophagus irregularis]|uniref:Uncharacterized protein n=2 Tax=Rhizophagus irregularis TaxID=588596 RepID=U9V4R9_RHIID|nr:18734_t:CDS:2 [Rhizophagus irregularis]
MGVVELWSSLFNENRIIWSMRRIWNINFGAVWKTLDRFINDSRFEISIFKVKVIQIIWADGLCKAALLDKDERINSEININNDYTWEYSVFWNNTMVKSNPHWPASLNIIMKEFNGISSLNNDSTAYNLKNYLEILPTFTMLKLNQRNPEFYETSRCCQCYETIETWTHLWICRENDTTMIQIINETFEKLNCRLDENDFRISFNYHAKLLQILNERSLMIFNGRIFHETVKGIVNKKLYLGINDNTFKDVIKEFVFNIKEYARKYIWNEM